jgi:pyruvate dehydrogenase E2 component (dihydrolipoamide acetyltransferase)
VTATTVVMPKMGYDMTQGKIVQWLKHEGDRVEKGEAIAEIETDKVNIQIEAFASGTLQKTLVHEGETVPVGQPIAQIGEAGEQPAAAQPSELLQQQEVGAGEGAEAPTTEVTCVAPERETAPTTPQPAGEEERVKASPIARRLAEEQGIELGTIPGSGPGGRITKEDVERYLTEAAARQQKPSRQAKAPSAQPQRPAEAPARAEGERAAPAPSAPSAPTPSASVTPPQTGQPQAPAPAVEPPEGVPVEAQELSRMGQAIARHMALSKSTIPHFYTTVEIDMSRVATLREELNQSLPEEGRLSFNDFVMKATAMALTHFPKLNSFYTEGRRNLFKQINLGMAIALEDGLIAPVIRECDRKSLLDIARESRELVARTRKGTLRQEDYSGGTFTVTNMGMLGVEEFAAIINPPQAAILAVGTVAPRPFVRDNALVVASTMKATLSADHRVVNGADAARYLNELKLLLESPARLLL